MRQRSLDNLLTTPGDLERYALGFHYVDDLPTCIIEWLRPRFIFSVIAPEVGETGLKHIQGYAETKTALTKSERQMFQGKGRFAKYLNPDVARSWWFAKARKNRQANVMYVLKDVHVNKLDGIVKELNPMHDPEELQDWIDAAYAMFHGGGAAPGPVDPGKQPSNFQEKIRYWYRDMPVDERPERVIPLVTLMCKQGVIPWQNIPNSRLIAAAEWLIMDSGSAEAREAVLNHKIRQIEKEYNGIF